MTISLLLVFMFISAFMFMDLLVLFLPYSEQYWWINKYIPLLCAAATGWFVWSRIATTNNKKELTSSVSKWAWAVGGIGGIAGFLGPLIFVPDANLGPLLGIMCTGPGGFLLGGIGRLVYWRNRQEEDSTE